MWRCLVLLIVITYVASSGTKVVIIGAGAAGIAAAARLLDNNVSDFRIFEAEDRIGGRIHSIHLGDGVVDLGAEYVHGQKENVVYQLAKDYLLDGRPVKNIALYYSGKLKTGDNLLETSETILYDQDYDFGSLGEKFWWKFNSTVLKKYHNDPEMKTFAKDFLRLAECFCLDLEGASNWYELTTSFGSFEDCQGSQSLVWQGRGFKTILEILLKNFPQRTGYHIDNQLSLNKKVSRVKLESDCVKVVCEDGTEYQADHVIFTPSLGVLKHDHKKIFQPTLNEAKINIIENLGFGGVMKIVFEFSGNWWGDINDFVFVWSDQDKKDLFKEIPFGPVLNGDHWLSWFYSIGRVANNTDVLIGWIVGPMLPAIEKLTEEQMKQGTVHVMKKFLGKDYNITEPTRAIHSKWCTNSNFRGSYSFISVDVQKKNIQTPHEILAAPIIGSDGVPRIIFAGEATNSKRFSTVDGAIGSGFRAADTVLELLRRSNTH